MTDDGSAADLRRWCEERGVNDTAASRSLDTSQVERIDMFTSDRIVSWRTSQTSNAHVAGTAKVQADLDSKLEIARRPNSSPPAFDEKRLGKEQELQEARREYMNLEAKARAGEPCGDRASALQRIQAIQGEIEALAQTDHGEISLLREVIAVRHAQWGAICRSEQEREAKQIAKAIEDVVPKALKAARDLVPALIELERLYGVAASDLAADANCPGFRHFVPEARLCPRAPAAHVLRNWINAMVEAGW